MFKKIAELWGTLPAEIKVACYIAVSYGLSAVITQISNIEISNPWLAIVINIVLVFLKEMKPRLDAKNK